MSDLGYTILNSTFKWLDEHTSWGWIARTYWWEHSNLVCHQQVAAKFFQDGCDAMSEKQWYEWFNPLTPREFIHVMLLGDPEPDDDADLIKDMIEEIEERLTGE